MADTTDIGPTSERETLTHDQRAAAVIAVENLIGNRSEADILCILMTTTIKAIHVIEDTGERQRIEEEYVKALWFCTRVEEQFQPEDVSDPPTWADKCKGEMARHIASTVQDGFVSQMTLKRASSSRRQRSASNRDGARDLATLPAGLAKTSPRRAAPASGSLQL
jgi:hypothetical protein